MGLKQNPRRQLTKLNKLRRPGIVLNRYHKHSIKLRLRGTLAKNLLGSTVKKGAELSLLPLRYWYTLATISEPTPVLT